MSYFDDLRQAKAIEQRQEQKKREKLWEANKKQSLDLREDCSIINAIKEIRIELEAIKKLLRNQSKEGWL